MNADSVQPKLLVLDDEIDMLNLLKRSLAKDLDCSVEVATRGDEALQKLHECPFHVVLADIRMPGMNGWISSNDHYRLGQTSPSS